MATRTRILASERVVTVASSVTTDLYVVPTDRVAIVKEIVVSQTAGVAPTTVWVYVDSGTPTVQVARIDIAVNDSPTVLSRWLVLEEGDILQLAQSSARTIDVHVSGTLLAGDPA